MNGRRVARNIFQCAGMTNPNGTEQFGDSGASRGGGFVSQFEFQVSTQCGRKSARTTSRGADIYKKFANGALREYIRAPPQPAG
jgi:hypothetical protein